tara:strand:+ start:950 stop:1393 length:444 start_codon:yes stop_codon:yes gene_type:complete
MKKIGEYTTRGRVADTGFERLILFDGRFDTGYKITKFRVYGDPNAETGVEGYGCLSTTIDPQMSDGGDWNFEANNQIAWATTTYSGSGGTVSDWEQVDPDNLVIEDLFIYAREGGGAVGLNYYIEMEKYEITDSQGALAMVRNRSQT